MDLLKPFRRAPRRKENPVWPAIVSLSGPTPFLWTDKDYALLSKAGYENVAAVFGCVSLIAKTCSSIDWYLMKGEDEIEDPNHPLLRLMARPNEYQSWGRFIESVVSFLLLSGNSYVLKVGGSSGPPRFLYTLRPDRVRVQPNPKNLIGGYIYDTGTTMKFSPEEILHLMEFHPTNDFYGLSRLEVAAKTIDIANLSMEWNANILHGDMRTPGAVKVNGTLTADQRKKLQDDLAKYQGAENVGKRIPIFEAGTGGMEWQPMAMTPKEMDWLNSDKTNTRKICSVFGVASELLGDSENKTYSNIKEARQALYMETVLPIMDVFKDDLNYWLAPLFGDGLVLDYDKDGIEALQEDRASKYSYLANTDWLTINEKREATGYDDIGPEGDIILVGIGKIPLEQAIAEPEPVPESLQPSDEAQEPARGGQGGANEPPDEEPPAEEPKAAQISPTRKASYWTEPERKGLLWKSFDRRVAAQERAMSALVKKYLRNQAERVSKRLAAGASLGEAFNIAAETEAYVKRFFPFYEQAFRWGGAAGYNATLGKLWDPNEATKADAGFKVDPEMLARLRQQITQSAKYFNTTTWNVVKSSIEEAYVNKLTNEAMAQQIWTELDSRAAWECRRISSTEMTRTDNWGVVEGYGQNEMVESKGWSCQVLDTSREDHIEADGQEVPKDDDFNIAGYAMYAPGDQRAPAGEVCNCRCSTYPIVEPV